MNLNNANLIGRVTRDPELKALPSGAKVVKFSIATNNSYKKEDGTKVESTQFHNCVAFGKLAELIAQYVTRGQEMYVAGRIEYRTWEKKDGTKGNGTEIVVDTMQFGAKAQGVKTETKTSPQASQTQPDPIEFPEEEIDPADIPF